MARANTKTKDRPEEDILVPEPRKITLANGEDFELPLTTWGAEIKILKVLKDVMAELATSGLFSPGMDLNSAEATQKIVTLILGVAADQLTDVAAAITRKDKKWVEDNLTIEPILEMVIDFLRLKQVSVGKVITSYLPTEATPQESAAPN